MTCSIGAGSALAMLAWGMALAVTVPATAAEPAPDGRVDWRAVGDGIPVAFAASGDAARGRALLLARDPANCVLCHALPEPELRFAGDLGPTLAGVGARLDAGQLRLRIADNMRLNPATIMPSYYRIEGFTLVAAAYRDRPILTALQVEDIVAYLATLK